jgi:hypothetical protein
MKKQNGSHIYPGKHRGFLFGGLTGAPNGGFSSTLNGVSSSLNNLASDLTKTLQSVITDLTDAIKLVGDTATTTLATVCDLSACLPLQRHHHVRER